MMDIADPEAAGAEYLQRIPGLAEKFEPENPGMHLFPVSTNGTDLRL